MSKTNQEIIEPKPFIKKQKQSKNNKKDLKLNQAQEEQSKNKFDTNYLPHNIYIPKYKLISDSRKYSKDSSNLSTSNEDFSEHDSHFKGKASDFKIKYKTELCKFYELTGKCKFGDNCAYAHGKENLRSKVTNTTAYRTKKCIQFFENGYCPYGSRCQFQHQLKNNIVNNPYDRGMSYKKILDIISKIENVRNIRKLVGKQRLNIFKEITGEEDDNKSRLLEVIKELIEVEDNNDNNNLI